jgi:hypothetical protein
LDVCCRNVKLEACKEALVDQNKSNILWSMSRVSHHCSDGAHTTSFSTRNALTFSRCSMYQDITWQREDHRTYVYKNRWITDFLNACNARKKRPVHESKEAYVKIFWWR